MNIVILRCLVTVTEWCSVYKYIYDTNDAHFELFIAAKVMVLLRVMGLWKNRWVFFAYIFS